MDDLVQEEMMELYKDPHNHGVVKNATAKFHDFNPVCGDEITVTLRVEKNIIEEVKFMGQGCVISQAAASLVTDHVTGKKTSAVLRMQQDDVLDLIPIEVSYQRMKCALLALKAIQKAIVGGENDNVRN